MMKHPDTMTKTCGEVPEFERLNFFYGQMLGAADFRAEQAYFREKLKLHNRCLHGYGVICGFEVTAVSPEDCCPPADREEQDKLREQLEDVGREIEKIVARLGEEGLRDEERKELEKALADAKAKREEIRRALEEASTPRHPDGSRECKDDKPGAAVLVHCGIALDCEGNEIVLRAPIMVDLLGSLGAGERARLREAGGGIVYLSVCYCGEPINPTRPAIPDSCGALGDCTYGRTRDALRFSVTTEAPREDERCETCCSSCGCDCLLLAAIAIGADGALREDGIDAAVRRPIGLYVPTAITGVSWRHGAIYSPDEAKAVLGTEDPDETRSDGIEITFSRPVYAETLAPGVIDIWRVQGGRGLRGMISTIEGDYVDKPDAGLVSSVRYRDESGETLNSGDRILIIVRGDFILDACCRALDGNHIGGRVPQLASYAGEAPSDEDGGAAPEGRVTGKSRPVRKSGRTEQVQVARTNAGDCGSRETPCLLPPGGIGPWRSGNGSHGGTFESWIFID